MMSLNEAVATPQYDVGEEVVVRLEGVTAMNADDASVRVSSLPRWTIGTITTRIGTIDDAHYALRFRHGDDALICVVPGSAIEGLA